MPTLFQRIFAYSKNNNLPILPVEKRSQLGVIVLEKWKVSGITKRYTKIKSKEYDFDGKVIHYPKEFRDEIDKVIKEFYDNPPTEPFVYIKPIPKVRKPIEIIQKSERLPIKKRKVIKRKGELVYSTKNQ